MDPVVSVTVPHKLGKAEAVVRIKAAIEAARTQYAAQFKIAEENWEGEKLRFRAAALGQTVTGTLDVVDDQVKTDVTLTWLMGHLVKPTEALIRREGERILGA